MIDPRNIPGAERIAHATTERNALGFRRDRWTEISIWYLHDGDQRGRRWLVETAGMTRVDGEGNRWTRVAVGTLERACKQIDTGGSAGAQVVEDAIAWADAHRPTIENGRGKALAFDTDRDALAWLYGEQPAHNGFPTMLARDTGAGASTVRMQLAADRPVMVPLRALLPFLDRDAFRRAREQEAAHG